MKLTSIECSLAKLDSQSGHIAALLDALGNPSEWHYTGLCTENPESKGRCACGQHGIRWEFHVEHGENKAVIGSSCIAHFQQITPELFASLHEAKLLLEARLNQARKEAKAALAAAANNALWIQYAALRDRAFSLFDGYKNERRRVPQNLYFFCCSNQEKYRRRNPPPYTRASSLQKWLTSAIKCVEYVIENP